MLREDRGVDPRQVPVNGETIRLGQLLKLADLVDSGSDAKQVIADGLVSVNGAVETRRGRQLSAGDVVDVAGQSVKVT
jgi:ribosome-associated protein